MTEEARIVSVSTWGLDSCGPDKVPLTQEILATGGAIAHSFQRLDHEESEAF